MSKTSLTMTVKVSYNDHGIPAEDLAGRLKSAINHAYAEGTLTGDTNAEVEAMSVDIRTRMKGVELRLGSRGWKAAHKPLEK